MKDYALYMGDTFIDLGTIEYLSKKYNLKKRTLYWYASAKRHKEQEKGMVVVKIEDDENEDN